MTTSFEGRTAVVTGGTGGIGKAIARALVLHGARVIVVGRDPEKGRQAEREIGVRFIRADLALVSETERLADEVLAQSPRLDDLVLSAGVVSGRRILTQDGIESNFAIGYLSRFVLVQRLLASMAHGSRILSINGAARNGRIYYEDVNLTRNFATLRAVSQLCEANDVFVLELARRLVPAGVAISGLKVGVVRTAIRRGFPLWMKILVPVLFDPFLAQTPERVAQVALRLLAAPASEQPNGALFSLIRRLRRIDPGRRTGDPAAGLALWTLSERLAAVTRATVATTG